MRVDLVAAVLGERRAQELPDVAERVRVVRAELADDRCRLFDIREEEGDGAGRQLGQGTSGWMVAVVAARLKWRPQILPL